MDRRTNMSDKFSFDPLNDLHNYREAIRQLLEGGWVLPRDLMPSAMNAIVVPVDVIDNGPDIIIKASLPGVRPDDVNITVLGETLTIKAAVPEEEEFQGSTYLRRERKATSFVRSLTLPVSVESERAEARFKNGVLTLILPKSESVRPRVIRVTTG
jgi:HSP20 family protein